MRPSSSFSRIHSIASVDAFLTAVVISATPPPVTLTKSQPDNFDFIEEI